MKYLNTFLSCIGYVVSNECIIVNNNLERVSNEVDMAYFDVRILS
jgi:hypothetical protein